MATLYLGQLVRLFKEKEKSYQHTDIRIVEGGTWDCVIKLTNQLTDTNPYSLAMIQAFPDKDVELEKQRLESIPAAEISDGEKKSLQLLTDNVKNITFLNITSELGVWEWLKNDVSLFQLELKNLIGCSIDLSKIVQQVENDEVGKSPKNPRKHAKGCIKNLNERLYEANNVLTGDIANLYLFKCYAEHEMQDKTKYEQFKNKMLQILNRK